MSISKNRTPTDKRRQRGTTQSNKQRKGRGTMDEQQFMIELIFKPNGNGLRLPPEETRLLLAYISEILQKIAEAERQLAAQQNAAE
jgi:hypothetical protein